MMNYGFVSLFWAVVMLGALAPVTVLAQPEPSASAEPPAKPASAPAHLPSPAAGAAGSGKSDRAGAPAKPRTSPRSPTVPSARDAREESLSERGLRKLVERQRALFEAAAASEEAGRFDEADFTTQMQQLCHAYEALLNDNPKFAAAYAAYGYLLGKLGMEDEGVGMLLRANQYDAEIPLVKNQIGNYLAERGRPLDAVNYYLAAIKLAPEEPLYHYQLGMLLHNSRAEFIRSGDWEAQAVDLASHEGFRKAAELAPERFEFVYRYAESFYDLPEPDWDGALRVWAQLESAAGSEIERQAMRLHAAKVCVEAGRRDHALALLGTVDVPELAAQREKLIAQAQASADN